MLTGVVTVFVLGNRAEKFNVANPNIFTSLIIALEFAVPKA